MTAIRNDLNVQCTECGGKVILDSLQQRECIRCGKKAFDREVCENGHFVCDECRRKIGSKAIYDTCVKSDSKNPIDLALSVMKDNSIRMHDLKHHTLVASCLLTTYKNSGGDIDLDAALRDADKRGSWFPGGICGLAGTCGAAASTGIYYSIITKTTPHSEGTWSDTNMIVADTLTKVASINGPRCCKRNTFIAILNAADYTEKKLGIKMELPDKIECNFSNRNEECIKEKCPFYKG